MKPIPKVFFAFLLIIPLAGCLHFHVQNDEITTWAKGVDNWIRAVEDSLEVQIRPTRLAICRTLEGLTYAQDLKAVPDSILLPDTTTVIPSDSVWVKIDFSRPEFCFGGHTDNNEIEDPPCPITDPNCKAPGGDHP